MRWVRLASAVALLSLSALALPGCSDAGDSGDTGGGGSGGDAPDETPSSCPALGLEDLGPGTIHEGDVEGTETWTADASPHIVRGRVDVRDGAKLVIEPCALVLLEENAELNVAYPITPNTGELVAEGTEARPIRFAQADLAPFTHIKVHAPGKASFAWVTIEGGGGPDTHRGESLEITGDGELPADPIVKVDHVTILDAAGTAVVLNGGAAFTEDSTDLTITGSGSEPTHFPLAMGELGIHTLPSGNYTGNAVDEILVVPEVISAAGGGRWWCAGLHAR